MKKLLLVFLLAATVAQAETYKWTDKEGTSNFSKSLGTDTSGTSNNYKIVASAEPEQRADEYGSVAPQVDELKERMLKDGGIMALIGALQSDPDMQALLGDPAIVHAIQAGDIGALVNNPDFQKLLNNPRVREIENRMQQGGMR